MPSEKPTPKPEADLGRPFRLTIEDLFGDLLWPKLFRVPRLALRADRIGLAVLMILLIGLIDQTLASMTKADDQPVLDMLFGLWSQRLDGIVISIQSLALGEALLAGWNALHFAVIQTFEAAPVRASIVLPISMLIYISLATGIARMSADDFARGQSMKWTEGLTWAIKSIPHALAAHLIPLAVIGLIVVVLAGGGAVLLGVPGLNLIGAVLSIIGIALAFVAVILMVGFGLGAPMLSPAVACEGFDGIDAMQRVYAYIFGRPARWFIYSLVLVLQFIVVGSIVYALAAATTSLASWAMGWWLGTDGTLVASGVSSEEMTWAGKSAARIVATVLKIPTLIAAGFVLVYWISGWTVQYLLLRQSSDGQDVTDIYVPGEMEARVELTLASRVAGIEMGQDAEAGESEDPEDSEESEAD
ncbi:MAG TPA: hypothetical protein ENJ00_08090 [Phycisphaerales bacterium]|nr:hypothetical protein [Phycisphaerales bacterium]